MTVRTLSWCIPLLAAASCGVGGAPVAIGPIAATSTMSAPPSAAVPTPAPVPVPATLQTATFALG